MKSVFIIGATLIIEAENKEEAIEKAKFMIGEYNELSEIWVQDELVGQ